MRVRSGAITSLMPIAAAMTLLAFCLTGARLYASSAASRAFDDQLAETCRSQSALVLALPDEPAGLDAVEEIASTLVHVQPARRNHEGVALMNTAEGSPRRLTIFHVAGGEQQLPPGVAPLALGEIALSRTNLSELATEVGATIATENGGRLRVAQVFDDVPVSPIPDFWCGWADLFLPTAGGDPPPPSAFASPETITRFGGVAYDEYRMTDEPLTIAEARDAEAAFETARATWDGRFARTFGETEPPEMRRILERAEAVTVTVQRSLAPVLLTAVVAVAAVLLAASVLLARSRHRELLLLAVRGLPPARIALGLTGQVSGALTVGALAGSTLAYVAVRWFGPSPLFEPTAVRYGFASVVAAVLVGVPTVAFVVASVADRSVDRRRRRIGAAASMSIVVIALAALAFWSFRTLDRDGGIRTFGVESRGGSLLALGFPLFALLAIVALVAMVLSFVVRPLRLTGGGFPRAVRLGWRRVVLESGPLAAIVVAIALAAGCLTTANALADAARRQLIEKADVYVGADLAISLYDPPNVPDDWSDRTSLATTARGRLDGGSFDLVGIDPATFAAVARLRSDASDLSLAELVELVATPPGPGRAPALAVGSAAEVGDIVELDVPGGQAPLQLDVVATAEFFPGKSSGGMMFIVDRALVDAAVPFPVSVLFVRDPPADAVAQLRAAGVRTGVVRDVDTAFDGSAYSALRWAYAPLAVLGALFALVALALQLLVVAARAGSRRATHAIMRRTGFGPRQLFGASLVESGIPLVVGTLVGVGASVAAVSLAVARLDPMPSLQPPTLFEMPWTTIVAIGAALPVWTAAIAFVITRSTTRADPLEVLHGAL